MSTLYKPDSDFVWTDLSTYDLRGSTRFYSKVFGWKTWDLGRFKASADDQFGMGQVSYQIAALGNDPVAGIFDMPPFFQKIKMPPFWMSYLAVDHLDEVVARARSIEGAIVDVEPTPFSEGRMALIRDPLGAGFTVYDGPSIDSKGDGSQNGRMIWNELITASIAKVETFYEEVLGLRLVRDDSYEGERVKVHNAEGKEIAGIQEVDESIRTQKVYWLPFFSVESLSIFETKLQAANGRIVSQTDFGNDANTALAYDEEGEAFAVSETGVSSLKGGANSWFSFWS
ncbi:MAG: VOC family protein [Verrucomicrobiota bacterium]